MSRRMSGTARMLPTGDRAAAKGAGMIIRALVTGRLMHQEQLRMPTSKMKNSRFAGELLVAAELTRLWLSVALHNTFGTNTQDFDLSAGN